MAAFIINYRIHNIYNDHISCDYNIIVVMVVNLGCYTTTPVVVMVVSWSCVLVLLNEQGTTCSVSYMPLPCKSSGTVEAIL